MKFKTTSDKGKPPKKKAKRNNIRWDAFMRTKLVFVLLSNYYQLFHALFNEIDTSRSSGTSRCTEIIQTRDEIRLGQPGHPGTPGSYKQALSISGSIDYGDKCFSKNSRRRQTALYDQHQHSAMLLNSFRRNVYPYTIN